MEKFEKITTFRALQKFFSAKREFSQILRVCSNLNEIKRQIF